MSIVDAMGRVIDYARISVTDRCNYRCAYCMPAKGVIPCPHSDIMRFEDIIWLARILEQLGVRHIRFTGGEPFARRGMADFLPEFRRGFPDLDVSVTTNASLIPKYEREIAGAGLSGMNISLDTLNSGKFAELTRTGDISEVTAGIDAALRTGISRIKTNTVLMRGFNDAELPEIFGFAWGKGMVPRVIEFMPLDGNLWGRDKFVGSPEILNIMKNHGDWVIAENASGASGVAPHGPAKYYADKSDGRIFGIINAVSSHFCSDCNRIRITAAGYLRACLFNNNEISMLEMIRSRDAESVKRAILSGINLKPGNWRECADGAGQMSGIGG